MNPIKVSVITSSMNRSPYLPRVWESLMNQTDSNFEWMIGNDGSQDNTIEVVESFFNKSNFPITLITSSKRIGKSMIDNNLISSARGEYILLCDSDDWLQKNAIEEMIKSAEDNTENDQQNFLGVIGLSKDNLGKCSGEFPKKFYSPLKLNDLFYIHKFQEDCAVFFKRKVLLENPFPEVDFYTPEGSIWSKIGHMKVTTCNKIVLNKEYKSKHAISFTNLFIYSRGKALSIAMLYKNLSSEQKKDFNHFLDIFTYLRFSFHGDVAIRKMFKLFDRKFWLLMIIILPISYLYSIKDLLQKRVQKTHLDFVKSCARYKLTINTNYDAK